MYSLRLVCHYYYCSNHSWVSFQGFCESYNDAFDLPQELGDYSYTHVVANSINFIGLMFLHAMYYYYNELIVVLLCDDTELTPHTVGKLSTMVNLRMSYVPLESGVYRFKCDQDHEVCMEMVEEHRRKNLYPHPQSQCTADCKSRGT